MLNLFSILLVSAKNPPYVHGSVKTVLHAFIHNLFTVGQWCSHSCVECMHSQYAVRWNLGRHMRCLCALMIRLLFSSWKRVAASTHIHIKKSQEGTNKGTDSITSCSWSLLCVLGTPSYSHNMFKMAEKEKLEKKGIFQRTEVRKQEKKEALIIHTPYFQNCLSPCEFKLSLCFIFEVEMTSVSREPIVSSFCALSLLCKQHQLWPFNTAGLMLDA